MIELSAQWDQLQPDAAVGIIAFNNVSNTQQHPALSEKKQELEGELRNRFGGMDRKTLRDEPVMAAYDAFYRPFRKTYHVQLQLESVVFKGRSIISPSALVTCMFMAELKTGLLTAAHDLEKTQLPLLADVATGSEKYQKLDGSEQQLKTGDLYIRDREGILSSVIYGPDQRTQIRPDTSRAVFTTYAPPGITPQQIQEQFEILQEYIRLFAPDGEVQNLIILPK